MCKGIRTLLDGHLTVEVLDGVSIGACHIQKNYQTAGTLMFLLNISGLLEYYTRARTKAALADSLAVKSDKVWLIRNDTDVLIPMSELKKGDMIRVRTGSMIPVDGEIADITLCGADLTELATLRKLSETLMARINRNYHFIIGFNSALLLLGFAVIITPSASAFLHNASTMAICAKSMTPLLKKDSSQNSAADNISKKA